MTKKHVVGPFIASPEAHRWAGDFHGRTPGSAAFSAKWREIAKREPEAFKDAQFNFIKQQNYDPAVASVKKATGYDLDRASQPVQQATFSAAVQHGQARLFISKAVRVTDRIFGRNDPRYQTALINSIYDRRSAYVASLRDHAAKVGDRKHAIQYDSIIRNRLVFERQAALRNMRI